ncbi:POTE1 protein, partial [Polyodon spathula]|nr:POTE1 protein [Polyodon spathula]
MDQSGRKLSCTLFSDRLEALPQIYKIGDIVRLHRIKTERFQGELKGVTSAGFSALTFDGRVGGPVNPRTGSKSYHFAEEDERKVEMLRQWAASRCAPSEQNLSTVQPKQFFDLTCQLVAKAELVKSVLLKVWDGTKCSHPVWKALEEEDNLEGNAVLLSELQNLTVDVLVYDNHIAVAKSLKPGAYLRINNLHAKFHASTAKKQTSNENRLQFHLHGGTMYGRGIQILPEDSYDVRELKKKLESAEVCVHPSVSDSVLLDFSISNSTLHEQLEQCRQESATVLTAHHHMKITSLNDVKNCKSPQKFRIRAKLKSYEPKSLCQSVKHCCPKCGILQEIPDDESVAHLFQDASTRPLNLNLHNAFWYKTAVGCTKNKQQIAFHFLEEDDWEKDAEKTSVMVERASLREIFQLSRRFGNIIPVTSSEEQLTLLDLSAPFLIQGKRWHYGYGIEHVLLS